jgi:hypothetical protein
MKMMIRMFMAVCPILLALSARADIAPPPVNTVLTGSAVDQLTSGVVQVSCTQKTGQSNVCTITGAAPSSTHTVLTGATADQLAKFVEESYQIEGYTGGGSQDGNYGGGTVQLSCVKKEDQSNACTVTGVTRKPASAARKKK